MAKSSMIARNNFRKRLCAKYRNKRLDLKKKIKDKTISLDERFALQMTLNGLPRNSSKARMRNRCAITGRPRGFHRLFGLSRNTLREYAAAGLIPGLTKSSW